ncbi:MAG: cytochrome P460 family protein, partial [Pseudomonadota bacterium]
AKAEQVCAACHGANGVSVGAAIPNLAGQKQAYLASQLQVFKSGARKNPLMNAIAAQISPADIANTAAFYAGLQGAAKGTDTSSMFPTLAMNKVKLPADFKKTFTLYQTVNYPERPQVRHLYANDAAVKAAKDGKPLPNGVVFVIEVYTPKLDDAKKPVAGADGNLVPDKIAFTTVMEKQAGWGTDIPEILRNADWNYGIFNADNTPRTTANQAECLACHKPLTKDEYLFSIKPLREFAMKK